MSEILFDFLYHNTEYHREHSEDEFIALQLMVEAFLEVENE